MSGLVMQFLFIVGIYVICFPFFFFYFLGSQVTGFATVMCKYLHVSVFYDLSSSLCFLSKEDVEFTTKIALIAATTHNSYSYNKHRPITTPEPSPIIASVVIPDLVFEPPPQTSIQVTTTTKISSPIHTEIVWL
ncbi:hypothetical protein L1987_76590 [Smallanthus sonchifolius]|uniref:Uncharacterized protein n=1 Tax=Smallanthus sonchifolius TaxID=185202 RepID=A0ACB8Z7V5_9ASTR|nr:hypothetical protein L1987_76590 [Smallanthus sonchifolius]